MKIPIAFVLLFSFLQPLFSMLPLPAPRTEEESLFVRRIVDFWRHQEFSFIKTELQNYLKETPDTPFSDHFYALLGEIALQEKMYPEATRYFEKIKEESMRINIKEKKWQALYRGQHYSDLYHEILPTLDHESDAGKFYFAESAFREGLKLAESPDSTYLFEQALSTYASLLKNPMFALHSKLAMAESLRLLGRFEEASPLYFELIDQQEADPSILIHAAAVISMVDPGKAMTLFDRLAHEGKKEAVYQWLQLLVKEKNWERIERERSLFTSKLEGIPLISAYFYLGMIAYDKQLYYQATFDLKKSLDAGLVQPNDRTALLAMLFSALQISKLEICEEAFELIKARYPSDKFNASLLLASAYEAHGLFEKAYLIYDEAILHSEASEIIDKAYAAKAHLLSAQQKWQEAHQVVLDFLNASPNSPRKSNMIGLAIEISLAQLGEEAASLQLIQDLERGFAANAFHEEEMEQKKELLVKAYLNLDQVDNALGLLFTMEKPDPYLFTLCYIKQGDCPQNVITYGEESLKQNPQQNGLHIHLFNAYLQRAKDINDESLDEHAANHLAAVIDLFPVSLENRLWLIHYFIKRDDMRAADLIEPLLENESNWKRFDHEAIALAYFYKKQGAFLKAQIVLEKVIAEGLDSKWTAMLEAASLFNKLGEKERAISLYRHLEECHDPHIVASAGFHLACLSFSEDPVKSLKKLEELKTRKSLANEPIHLESALEYAERKASLEPPENRKRVLLNLFQDMKQDFTIQDNILSKDYHAARKLMPEKEILFQAYMRYLDARILLLQAEEARQKRDLAQEKLKAESAHAMLSSLLKGKFAVTKYLVEKAEREMYE